MGVEEVSNGEAEGFTAGRRQRRRRGGGEGEEIVGIGGEPVSLVSLERPVVDGHRG